MKDWRVKIQLGNWVGYVEIQAETAKEAHRAAFDAVLAIQAKKTAWIGDS